MKELKDKNVKPKSPPDDIEDLYIPPTEFSNQNDLNYSLFDMPSPTNSEPDCDKIVDDLDDY